MELTATPITIASPPRSAMTNPFLTRAVPEKWALKRPNANNVETDKMIESTIAELLSRNRYGARTMKPEKKYEKNITRDAWIDLLNGTEWCF